MPQSVGAAPALRLPHWKQCSYILCVLLLAGCSQTKGWLDRVSSGSDERKNDPVILGAPSADDYLRDLDLMANGDPATQVELFADAESRATLTPNPSTELRFALILAAPGHADSNAVRAQGMLRELLTQPALMTPSEIALAQIHLKYVEERIVLESEANRLRASSSRASHTEELAINQRLANVERENRRLRAELAEAENKLEAITSIERSIREQDQ